jgi:hypothetical protein
MERAMERFGFERPLPNLIVLEKSLPKGTTREIAISSDAALGGIVKTVYAFDLLEVKRMIGFPDRLAQQKKPRKCGDLDLKRYSPSELERAYNEANLTLDQYEFIKAVGRAYVFGYSPPVSQFKAIVEKIYTRGSGRFDLTIVCFGTVRVRNGYSLVITPSFQSFCASALHLEPEASVVRTGNADIKFNIGQIRVVEPDLPFKAIN